MNTSSDLPSGSQRSRLKNFVLWFTAIGIIFPGGYGFISKLLQFIKTLETDSEGAFTIIPISNYLIMASGFTCLLVWGAAHGMFRDIEKPKYTMLERDEAIERAERQA
jgi:nitrate reductase NapE component